MKLSEVVAPGNKSGRVDSTIIPPFVNFVQPCRVIYIPKVKILSVYFVSVQQSHRKSASRCNCP